MTPGRRGRRLPHPALRDLRGHPGVTANIEEWLGVDVVLQLLDETQSVTAALEAVSFRF